MINREYFIAAKVTDSTGYCYISKIGSYKSFLSNPGAVFALMTDEVKKELLSTSPTGQFEVIAFNRV